MNAAMLIGKACQGSVTFEDCFIWDGGGYESQWERENMFREYFGNEYALGIGLELLEDRAYLCVPARWWKLYGYEVQSCLSGNEKNIFVLCENNSYIVLPLE